MTSINILGFEAQFPVGSPAVINVPMLDSSNNPVTGRTYPTSLGVQLWKSGVIDSSAQLSTITSVETTSGIYRTTIPGALIDTQSVDYLLVVSDSSNVALTQRVEFLAYKVSGFQSRFLVGSSVITNVPMLNSSGQPVPGLTYPGNLNIQLWNSGYDTSAQLFNVTAAETASGVYRVTLPPTLITTSGTDYELIVSDSSNVALTQRIQFSASPLGPRIVVLYAVDSFSGAPIPGTQVFLKDSSNTFVVYNGTTDASGKYIAGLNNGAYNVILIKSFVNFPTPISLNISADTTAVCLGTSFSPASPVLPSTCILYGWISDMAGRGVRNAQVTAVDPVNVSYSSQFKIGKVNKQTVTDNNGYWSLELIRNSQLNPTGIPYTITQTYAGFSYSKNVIIPDSSSVEFSTL